MGVYGYVLTAAIALVFGMFIMAVAVSNARNDEEESLTISEYKLIFDTGEVATIRAKTRGQAIEIYCAGHGVSVDWAKAHCIVKNLGRVSDG